MCRECVFDFFINAVCLFVNVWFFSSGMMCVFGECMFSFFWGGARGLGQWFSFSLLS